VTVHTTNEDFDQLQNWLSNMINDPHCHVTQRVHVSFIQFQPEQCPETNRVHFQVYAQFSKAVDMTKAFAFFTFEGKQFHVEACKGSSDDNLAYTSKSDTRLPNAETITLGEARKIDKKTGAGARSDLASFKTSVDNGASWQDILDNHFSTVAQNFNFAKSYYETVKNTLSLDEIKAEMASITLRGWQNGIKNLVQEQPDSRSVHWFWENEGNVGKSFMARYLSVTVNALIVQSMKKADMVYLISKYIRTTNVVVFDMCRSSEQGAVTVVYEVIEMLKNGYLTSGKYDSSSLTFKPPHVLCFANFEPDKNALSRDRWKIVHLHGLVLAYETVL